VSHVVISMLILMLIVKWITLPLRLQKPSKRMRHVSTAHCDSR